MSENQAKIIYLAIGSNLGNKKKNIELSKSRLIKKNIKILECSNYYESSSWPDPSKPKFLNIVLKVTSNLPPLDLLNICKDIELEIGRRSNLLNAPRKCDIDIIDYKKIILKNKIILPHPRMHTRNFVLLPLFEIDKNWVHPITKHHIKSLILSLSNKDIRSIKQI